MQKIVILDAGTLGEDLSLDPLRALGQVCAYPATAVSDIPGRVADCDILIQNKVRITKEVPCRRLRPHRPSNLKTPPPKGGVIFA